MLLSPLVAIYISGMKLYSHHNTHSRTKLTYTLVHYVHYSCEDILTNEIVYIAEGKKNREKNEVSTI